MRRSGFMITIMITGLQDSSGMTKGASFPAREWRRPLR